MLHKLQLQHSEQGSMCEVPYLLFVLTRADCNHRILSGQYLNPSRNRTTSTHRSSPLAMSEAPQVKRRKAPEEPLNGQPPTKHREPSLFNGRAPFQLSDSPHTIYLGQYSTCRLKLASDLGAKRQEMD